MYKVEYLHLSQCLHLCWFWARVINHNWTVKFKIRENKLHISLCRTTPTTYVSALNQTYKPLHFPELSSTHLTSSYFRSSQKPDSYAIEKWHHLCIVITPLNVVIIQFLLDNFYHFWYPSNLFCKQLVHISEERNTSGVTHQTRNFWCSTTGKFKHTRTQQSRQRHIEIRDTTKTILRIHVFTQMIVMNINRRKKNLIIINIEFEKPRP